MPGKKAGHVRRGARLEVYARDGWQCRMPDCLCPAGRAIDPGLLGENTDWAPSVDHIVPRSEGGRGAPGNYRAAHRYCNAAARS